MPGTRWRRTALALVAGALSVGLVACSPAQSEGGLPTLAPAPSTGAVAATATTPASSTAPSVTVPSTTAAPPTPIAAGAKLTVTVSGETAVAKLVTSTGVPAAGTVTFAVDGTTVGSAQVAKGQAAVAVPAALALGKHTVTASFASKNAALVANAKAAAAFTTAKAGSTISATVGADAIRYGDQMTVDVTVKAPKATAGADLAGHVVLRDGGSIVAEGDTDSAGHASLGVLNRANPGTKTYTVTYAGAPTVAASSTDLAVRSARTNVDIAITWPDGLLPKDDAAITVDVVGTPDSPTGVATVSADGKQIAKGPVDADGRISGTAAALSAGDHQIEVSYAGDARFEPNTASATLTVKEPLANPNAAGAAAAQAGNPCPAAASACVDLSDQQAWLQTGGKITYGPVPMTSGREGHRTGTGMFSVFWLDKDHKSSLFDDAPMPNSVFFDSGIAFHAGSLSDQSHGCIHLSWDASETFFDTLSVGDGVYVWGAPPY